MNYMCRNCGDCTAEHSYTTDDAIDAVEDSPLQLTTNYTYVIIIGVFG